jgi:hypothetical protein
MLRNRGRNSLDLSGLQPRKYQGQGIYTFSLKNRVLLRNKMKKASDRQSAFSLALFYTLYGSYLNSICWLILFYA